MSALRRQMAIQVKAALGGVPFTDRYYEELSSPFVAVAENYARDEVAAALADRGLTCEHALHTLSQRFNGGEPVYTCDGCNRIVGRVAAPVDRSPAQTGDPTPGDWTSFKAETPPEGQPIWAMWSDGSVFALTRKGSMLYLDNGTYLYTLPAYWKAKD